MITYIDEDVHKLSYPWAIQPQVETFTLRDWGEKGLISERSSTTTGEEEKPKKEEIKQN